MTDTMTRMHGVCLAAVVNCFSFCEYRSDSFLLFAYLSAIYVCLHFTHVWTLNTFLLLGRPRVAAVSAAGYNTVMEETVDSMQFTLLLFACNRGEP